MEGQEKVKQPKKLTRELKIAVSAYNLNPEHWMLLKDEGGTYVTIVNKESGKTRIIGRYAKPKKGEKQS